MSDTIPSGFDDASRLAPGTTFAGHRIESELGRGGMGVVYRARHLALDRERALKLIAPSLSADPGFRERFQRESRLAASIEHPNVIPVHHAGEEGGLLYLSMRLIDGADLRRIVAAEGPLPVSRTAFLIAGVAAGLDAAHDRGLIHRDVKPANVLVEEEDDVERVFLTDFGISRIAGAGGTVTSSGELLGSADYVSPEQIEGKRVDRRADVYALGCVVHYTLTGEPPFQRDTDIAKLFAHANAPRPRPSELVDGLPPGIDGVVGRAMAIRPADRYPTAGELAADLERVAGGAANVASPRAPAPPAPDAAPTRRLRRPVRRRTAMIAAGLVAVVAAGIAAVLLISGEGSGGSGSGANSLATVDVGRGPVAIAVGASHVWVASRDDHALYEINPVNNRAEGQPVPIGGKPTSITTGFGSLWVGDQTGNRVLRVDPSDATSQSIHVGRDPADVAVDRRWVWVANERDDTVSRIDPTTNRVNKTIPVGGAPHSIAATVNAVLVADTDRGAVARIDPETAKVVGKPISVGGHPDGVAVGQRGQGGAPPRYAWVSDGSAGVITRIDLSAADPVGPKVSIGGRPSAVAVGLGYVWVASDDGTVTKVAPTAAKRVGDPIPVGRDPVDVDVGRGVWTANFADGTVTRISP